MKFLIMVLGICIIHQSSSKPKQFLVETISKENTRRAEDYEYFHNSYEHYSYEYASGSVELSKCQVSADCSKVMDAAVLCIHGECVSFSVGQASKNHTLENPECHQDQDCGSFTKCQGQDCWCESINGYQSTLSAGGICEPRNGCKICIGIHQACKKGLPCFCSDGECFGNEPTTKCQFTTECNTPSSKKRKTYSVCNQGNCVTISSLWSHVVNHPENPECRGDEDCEKLNKCQGKDCWCQAVMDFDTYKAGGTCEPRNDCKFCREAKECEERYRPCYCRNGECFSGEFGKK